MVGAGRVVAERDRGVPAEEDRAGVADLRGDRVRVAGLDLQVLGRVGVDDGQALLQVVDQDEAGLPAAEGLGHPLRVLGPGDLGLQLGLDRVGELHRGGDQHRARGRAVLGLADQVGGDLRRVGGVVGEDGDLGRSGLGVDADPAREVALGGGHVDVAGAGDHVHRLALLGAEREHRDRLGAADRVHLGDAEQGARGQDGRVHPAAEGLLRRRGHRDPGDARLLGRHHVHHYGGRVDGQAARHVQPDPVHRHPALGHRAAGHHLGGVPLAALVGVDQPGPADRLLQCGAHLRLQLREGLGELLGRDPGGLQPHAVEAFGDLDQRRDPAMMHVLGDRAHLLQGGRDVEVGTGQQAARVVERAAQIDSRDHVPQCKEWPEPAIPHFSP